MQLEQKAVLFWYKLYGPDYYECFNIYNNQGDLLGFVSREYKSIIEKNIPIRKPQKIRSFSKVISKTSFKDNYHILIDPKLPESIQCEWGEYFSKILAKSISKSLGHSSLFFSPSNVWEDIVKKNNFKNKIVVDIGTGLSNNKRLFSAKRFIGLDIVKSSSGEDNISLNAEASRIPIKNNSVDCVLCLFVLEHTVMHSIIIREINRILKDNGNVIIALPVLYFENEDLTKKIFIPFFHTSFFSYCNSDHPWFSSVTSLLHLFESCGLVTKKIKYYNSENDESIKNLSELEKTMELYLIGEFSKN